MIPAHIHGATLRGEVVNYDQSILGIEGKNLVGIGGGRPRCRQVQPIHASAKMLLFQCRQFALESSGFSG